MLIAILVHARSGQASECGWYFVVYCLDCSLGLTLAITFHKLTTGLARWLHARQLANKDFEEEHPWWEALVEIGHYGDAANPNMRKWAIQVMSWVSCVVSARSIVAVVVLTMTPVFMAITAFMDKQFVGHPNAYLYTIMVCIPLVVNIGQAWIQDQVLKWKHRKLPSGKRDDDDDWDLAESSEGGLVKQLIVTQQQPRNR